MKLSSPLREREVSTKSLPPSPPNLLPFLTGRKQAPSRLVAPLASELTKKMADAKYETDSVVRSEMRTESARNAASIGRAEDIGKGTGNEWPS